MKLPWLKSALDNNDGPFLSVYLDTTRTDPTAASEVETRWGQFRDQLSEVGAPRTLLDKVENSVLRQPSIGGSHGRAVLANASGILLDRVLPLPPQEGSAHWGDDPELLPLVRLTPHVVSQLLIEVDRAGADLHLRAPEEARLSLEEDIDGGHDELHKSRSTSADTGRSGRGWRSDNFEARVEDSWERNAEAVADKVNRLVAQRRPDMILLTGDVRAEALLKAELKPEVLDRLHHLSGGTRGVSFERESFREELAEVTRKFIESRQEQIGERFRETQSRDVGSVAGSEHVSEVLQRGQADELIFITGQEPDNIEDLIRRAISTDAGVWALEDGYATIPGGVGAFLRWDDPATPSNQVPSMSGDPAREDAVDPDRDGPSPREEEEKKLLG